MTITIQTDRVTGIRTTRFVGNGRSVTAFGRSTGDGAALKLVDCGDGVHRLMADRSMRKDARPENVGIRRRFFWRVKARFGAGWSGMTDAQISREMRMVSNRRAH